MTIRQKSGQTKGDLTKVAIMEGVRNLLAEQDFDTISIEDIVAETGIPVGSIYFHFKNKNGLFHAIAAEQIDQFFDYFINLCEEDLFGAAFLYCWRSIQQHFNRRGNAQLTVWHLQQDVSRLELSWAPKRQALVETFADIITRETPKEKPREQNVLLAELLLLGTENLTTMLLTFKQPPDPLRGKTPRDMATSLAATWYRAATGRSVDLDKKSDVIKRIVRETKLLERSTRKNR